MYSKCYVVVDIDGTISKVGDRIKCLEQSPKDWDSFYARCGEDLPNEDVLELIKTIQYDYTIIFVSGRRESCREDTVEWLDKYDINNYEELLLRKDRDYRHDTIVKPELLLNFLGSYDEVAFVLEDRSSVVKKWRELGLTCLQVAEGDF